MHVKEVRDKNTTGQNIDRHALQEARAAAKQKADELYKHEMAKVTKPLEDRLNSSMARRDQLASELRTVEDDIKSTRKALNDILGIEDAPEKAPTGKRQRLGAETLSKIAASMRDYIKRQPEPISGGAIKQFLVQFHGGYKIQSPMPFLDKYLPDHGVKAEGAKASTRYS